MVSRKGPASSKLVPLSWSCEVEDEVVAVFQESQREECDRLTDTNLVCKDGVIPVHAIMLKSASTFFSEALESQGDNYMHMRSILMPDYSVKEMRLVIQVIYTGGASFYCNENAKVVKDILKELCVGNGKISKIVDKIKSKDNSKFVRCYLTNHMDHSVKGKQIGRMNHSKPVLASTIPLKKKEENKQISNHENAKTKDKTTVTVSSSSSDSDSDSDYDPEKDKEEEKPKTSSTRCTSKYVVPKVVIERSVIPPAKPVYPTNTNQAYSDESDSDDWDEPDYKNKVWFQREAKRCQKCNKDHESPALASQCITSHTRLRCYFCFTIAQNTEKLFDHFKKKHKQAGKENCLMCPYCEQTIAFKSVSCHVISVHLSDTINNTAAASTAGRGRPSFAAVASGPQQSTATIPTTTTSKTTVVSTSTVTVKRTNNGSASVSDDDDGILRVGDLNVTIRKTLGNGKVRVYELYRDRSC